MTAVDLRGGPALTLVTGPPGVGRTHALRATADAAARDGARVLALRLAPEDRHEPWYLAGRILAALSPARGSGRVAEPPAAALTGTLRRRPGLLLVLDDAQWADPESAEAIGDVLDDPAGSAVRCVAALRTGGGPAVPRPRPGLRARVVALRPRRAAEAEAFAARLLRATPHEDLAAALRRYGAGVPAAIDAVIAGYRDTGQLVVADGRAGLRDPGAVPVIPTGHQLLRPVRRLDRSARAVARALAVLQPFGSAAPALIGQALGLTPDEVDRQLAVARTEESPGPGRAVGRSPRRPWRSPSPPTSVPTSDTAPPRSRPRRSGATASPYPIHTTCPTVSSRPARGSTPGGPSRPSPAYAPVIGPPGSRWPTGASWTSGRVAGPPPSTGRCSPRRPDSPERTCRSPAWPPRCCSPRAGRPGPEPCWTPPPTSRRTCWHRSAPTCTGPSVMRRRPPGWYGTRWSRRPAANCGCSPPNWRPNTATPPPPGRRERRRCPRTRRPWSV
ncbi:AAA family ATPase [Micromonospora sp. CA-246542]|uniref:ATP-binding protein n=1 Tax=Micromonospora sp. CA-246542 TaxID=3239959 RepID=UPI003D8F459F